MNAYDYLLGFVVITQALVIAYVRSPTAKAWTLTVPAPFAVATLALQRQADATFLVGLLLMVAFTFLVWWLHARRAWPVIISIVGAALLYCLLAVLAIALLRPVLQVAFLPLVAVTIILAAGLLGWLPAATAPPHRCALPIYLKLPILVLVVTLLVLLKNYLAGAMPLFPMVGVISCYEMRHSLWTQFRQMPLIMLCFALALVLMHRLAGRGWSLGMALGVGLVAYLAAAVLLARLRAYLDQRSLALRDQTNKLMP